MNKDLKSILSKVKENWKYYMIEFKNCFNDIKHKDTFYKQIPNLLTIFRVVGIIPFNILFLTGNMISGVLLLGLILLTDFFDGKIARKYGIVTKFGADLDAICDKIMTFGLIIPLIIECPLLIVNLLLEASIATINVFGRLKGIDTKTLFSGKVKTWLLSLTLGLGYLTKFITDLHSLFVLFSLITMSSQIKTTYDYIKYSSKEDKKIKETKNEDKIDMTRELTREEKIEELVREKEFLLSSQDQENNRVKVKKRNK